MNPDHTLNPDRLNDATNAANSIVLIGMPASGKTTIGLELAKRLNKDFIDTDKLIETLHKKRLQTLLEAHDYRWLREQEAKMLLSLTLDNAVVATGGSAVYCAQAMSHLREQANIVYLHVPYETIRQRLKNESSRGIARPPKQSLLGVYNERAPLYEQFADSIVDNSDQQLTITSIMKMQGI